MISSLVAILYIERTTWSVTAALAVTWEMVIFFKVKVAGSPLQRASRNLRDKVVHGCLACAKCITDFSSKETWLNVLHEWLYLDYQAVIPFCSGRVVLWLLCIYFQRSIVSEEVMAYLSSVYNLSSCGFCVFNCLACRAVVGGFIKKTKFAINVT